MRTIKRVVAVLLMAGALGMTGAVAFADGPKVCAPGQQGNPQPGFKPGSCK